MKVIEISTKYEFFKPTDFTKNYWFIRITRSGSENYNWAIGYETPHGTVAFPGDELRSEQKEFLEEEYQTSKK